MASDYTPAPQNVDGEIIANDGKRALVVKYLEDGGVSLNIYQWREDKRYNTRKGNWGVPIFGTINLTFTERKALNGIFK